MVPGHMATRNTRICIAWQELFAIIVACPIWGELLQEKRIIFNCDNEAVVSMINTKRSRAPKAMDLIRRLTLLTMQYNFYIRAQHIPGKRNEIADSLSRFQHQQFTLHPDFSANNLKKRH